jgi:hypothetical protein
MRMPGEPPSFYTKEKTEELPRVSSNTTFDTIRPIVFVPVPLPLDFILFPLAQFTLLASVNLVK